MRSTRIMGLFAFGRSTEHEKRGCVGKASRAETIFRLAATALQFVEDTFTQERGSEKGYLQFFLYFSSGSTYMFDISRY